MSFDMQLYSHDTEIQRLFSYMQFGIICENTVRKIKPVPHKCDYPVRRIAVDELTDRWDEIWCLLYKLIEHLQKSPVFYPGREFNENMYREFFTDRGISVYIAEDEERIIGIIEANAENYDLIFENGSMNVGEAFVLPEYRGKGIAQALLSCLESDLKNSGVGYDWVMHGTANPTARGYLDKYFETVEYEFVRKIEIFRE